ncbi:MAG: DPP IV N-terminal domain-containing protein [Bacteroidales bacterium]|nr:DPP IV N-terminal domain-containing protein [Bacteroidales bacterium]MBQ9186121.1 DPP IV N-terminal domain-containing protein [Bacteroidales bacterium]
MKKFFLAIACGLVALSAAGQQPDYEQAARFTAKRVNQMVFSTRITPNWFRYSNKFWYSWSTPEGTKYYIADPAAGSRKEVFDMERLAMQISEIVKDPFEAKHLPIKELRLEEDKYFLFDISSSATTKDPKDSKKTIKKVFHFRYDIASGALTEEKDGKKDKYPRFANVSPDGTKAVYVKNHNLWWADSTSLRKMAEDPKDSTIVEHALTKDGTADFSWNGNNYSGDTQKDSTKRTGAFSVAWSPDSKHFATMRWDMSKVNELWVINSVKSPRPELETYKYQMPGEPGPVGTLYIFDMASGESRKVATHAFKDQDTDLYSARETAEDRYKDFRSNRWLGDNNGFYMLRTSRDLKRHDLCYVGLNADSTHVVVKERSNTYVENRTPFFIKGGSQFIWWSERNGWANLYLYNADGSLVRNLTEGAFHVNDVLGVNEAAGYVLFSACGVNKDENPYQTHNFKVSLGGGAIKQLDMQDMDVLATPSFDAKYFVANYSRVDAKPAVALYDAAQGRKVCELEEADFSLLFAAGYKFPERFKVKAADGVTDLYGAMYKPFNFDSTKTYPIIDYVYPGPQVEANNISWSRGFLRLDRLAQVGFVVITVGNRGGHPNRSKWYHNYGYGNLRDYGLEDQKYAIQQLAGKYSYIDGTRVGIHGHSGGGFMSTAAILKYPDFFKAAVSCAGNHDNRIYNRWWSEQHHGILEKIEKADTSFVYSIKTNQELASRLKGHLMLVTGDMDNNVNPANTIRVVDALIRANKRFDLLVLPGQRHGFGDMNEYFFWRLADYFSEWLLGSSKRWQPDIIEMNND